MEDTRLPEYHYWSQLQSYLKSINASIRNGSMVYPRQMEIHLSGNHIKPCNLHCQHCAGKFFTKDLGTWELDGLEILNKLEGKIPYHIYGGAYTEPLLNPYFMTYLATTKKYDNHFGIHTNGTLLYQMEQNFKWLTELNRISTDNVDYLSISLDAGERESWAKEKVTNHKHYYDEILEAIELACEIRNENKNGHAIRVCYLISSHTDSEDNIRKIVEFARKTKFDSLRFSIPFASYNQDFDKVRDYKAIRELPANHEYIKLLQPYLSTSMNEKPYIFYTSPEFTDIDKFTFKDCVYPYYQITLGADGYVYRCSTTATPTMKFCRLGKITNRLDDFKRMIKINQMEWDTSRCFKNGARCNRMGLEINTEYAK